MSRSVNARRNILVVTELFPNVTNSFLGTFVVQQLKLLRSTYNIVVVMTYHIPFSMRWKFRQPFFATKDGIQVYSVRHMPFWLAFFGFLRRLDIRIPDYLMAIDKILTRRKVSNLARVLHSKYDFVLVHGHEVQFGDEAAVIGRILKIPSIFTLHGIYDYHVRQFGKTVLARVSANIEAMDLLIAVSNQAAKSYNLHGVSHRFAIVPNGIFMTSRGRQHARTSLPRDIEQFIENRLVLLTVGFLVPEKRIEYAIQTLARLHKDGFDETVLIIIGKGPFEERLRRMIQFENLGEFVRLVGEVKPDNMSAYYRASDVLVHPSIVDSLSMVCLEAMSFGIPVICTSQIGLTEFLHPNKDALVVPADNLDALYNAIRGLIKDPSKRRSIGRNAQLTAATFEWHKQIRKIERVYEQALSS